MRAYLALICNLQTKFVDRLAHPQKDFDDSFRITVSIWQ